MPAKVKMTLKEYLSGPNFHKYDAYLMHGGKITAHHGRDISTEKFYSQMEEGQFLVSFKMPDGDYWRCQIISGDMPVTCMEAR